MSFTASASLRPSADTGSRFRNRPFDATLPHRDTARRTRALRELRRRAPCLAFVLQPPLPAHAANPRWLGAVPGFSLVLHTWSQDLRMHLHVHALSGEGASKVFRGKFLARLDSAHRSGELKDDPHAAPGPWQARRRVLLGCDAGEVRLRVRDNETGGKRTVSLPGDTFIGRFLCHVLPAGFKRLRHCGLLAAAQACLAGRRTRGAPFAGTATGRDRSDRRLPRPRDQGSPPMLSALRARALAHGLDRHGSPVRSARAGAALSGWTAMSTHTPLSRALPMQRPHRQAVARPRVVNATDGAFQRFDRGAAVVDHEDGSD